MFHLFTPTMNDSRECVPQSCEDTMLAYIDEINKKIDDATVRMNRMIGTLIDAVQEFTNGPARTEEPMTWFQSPWVDIRLAPQSYVAAVPYAPGKFKAAVEISFGWHGVRNDAYFPVEIDACTRTLHMRSGDIVHEMNHKHVFVLIYTFLNIYRPIGEQYDIKIMDFTPPDYTTFICENSLGDRVLLSFDVDIGITEPKLYRLSLNVDRSFTRVAVVPCVAPSIISPRHVRNLYTVAIAFANYRMGYTDRIWTIAAYYMYDSGGDDTRTMWNRFWRSVCNITTHKEHIHQLALEQADSTRLQLLNVLSDVAQCVKFIIE